MAYSGVARPVSFVIALVLVIGLWPASASADWPVPRGNAARTGAVESRGDLHDPEVSWRYYLGGAISDRAAYLHDVDQDGQVDVIFVSAGRLIAKRRDDVRLWQTPIHGISSVIGIADFDGDTIEELVAVSGTRVFLVEIRSGAILWTSPLADANALEAVRIGDLDGDGLADLLTAACPCCRVTIDANGFAYRFADGFSASPEDQRMWELPDTSCGGRYSMVLWDPNGDGRLDATFSDAFGIGVVDGATGLSCLDGSTTTCQAESRQFVPRLNLGRRANAAYCVPANIDTRVGDELLCMQNDSTVDVPDPAHRVFALGYRSAVGSTQARLEVRWERVVGTRERLIAIGARPVADLDGDGRLEYVVSGVLADDRWATYILDAATGNQLGQIDDQRIVGTVDLSGQSGGPVALTLVTEKADTLWGWSFQRQDMPRIRGRWSLAQRRALAEPDIALARTMHVSGQLSARDVTGDNRPELFTIDQERTALYAHDLAGLTPDQVASHAIDAGSAILEVWTRSAQEAESATAFVATSDGVMHALDDGLVQISSGLRFGGYYPKGDWRNLGITPVTGDLTGAVAGTPGADSVVITDARGALVRIDALPGEPTGNGDEVGPPNPTVIFSVTGASSPIIVRGLADGAPGIACQRAVADGTRHIQVLSADGQVVRDHDLGSAWLLSDMAPAQLDDDGVTDLIVEWGLPGDLNLNIQALDGATLTPRWHTVPPFEGTTRFPAGGAVTDWDGDGIDDYIHQYYRTQIISGRDGAILDQTAENGFYYMPIVTQLDDDPRPELVLQGGYNPIQTIDDDLSSIWQSTDDNRPYPYGALARCGSSTYLVEGSLAQPSTLHRTRVDTAGMAGGQPAETWARILAHGQIYADLADAQAGGDFLGQLTSALVHQNLTGDGRPIALVGSEDGFLYAIDACTGAMEFAMQFEGSVGAIVFGDTDGDSFDEVLVAVADGYLYAIDSGDVSGRGYLVGCQCESGGPDGSSWLLALFVLVGLVRRNRSAVSV